MANLAEQLRESAESIESEWCDLAALDDAALVASVQRLQAHVTLAQTLAATVAGEVESRSSRELGHSGLAARNGFRSPEQFIQTITKSTRAEANALVGAGRLMRDATLEPVMMPVTTGEVDDAGCPVPLLDDSGMAVVELVEVNPTPWLAPVAAAVSAGELSASAAEAIRKGLGDLNHGTLETSDSGASDSPALTIETLRLAAEQLVELGARLNADLLYKRARQLRDELDAAGVAERERAQHNARSFKVWKRADGSVAGSFHYGPEDGALLLSVIDSVMSPRRGGPRFVDASAKEAAKALVEDPRSNDQIQADTFIAILQLAADADPGTLFGNRRPAVKVIVTRDALTPDEHGVRHGFGRIEGSHEAVSLDTIDRHICNSGTIGVSFTGNGQALDLGREARLFSRAQREVMAIRDGGCIGSESCDAPPSLCEAHHTNSWHDGGRTDVNDGVLLCRFHHMNLHNTGSRIVRDGSGNYWLIPPPDLDPAQTPIRLHSKNPIFRRDVSSSYGASRPSGGSSARGRSYSYGASSTADATSTQNATSTPDGASSPDASLADQPGEPFVKFASVGARFTS